MSLIDLHTHILPGLDRDGPPDLDSALELARALVRQGFQTVVATPHCFEGKPYPADILYRLELFQKQLAKNSIPLRVLPGSEHVVEPRLLERVQTGELLTLNKTRYLLLELPSFQPLPPYFEKLLFELRACHYYPVLAHPERVEVFQNDLDLFYRLVCAGCLAQLTLGSLTGLLGRETRQAAEKMLAHDLAHFLATDAHSPGGRLGASREALRLLEKQKGDGAAALIMTRRPALLLAGKRPALPEPQPVARRKKFFLLNRQAYYK